MKKLYLIFILLSWRIISAQDIKIDTFSFQSSNSIYPDSVVFMHYPIIKTRNQLINNAINEDVKNRLTYNQYPDISIDSAIQTWAYDDIGRVVEMNFKVTYSKNDLISFHITTMFYGAYLTLNTDYFTYNYKTGKPLAIDQIIDTNGYFKDMVVQDKDKQYESEFQKITEILEYDDKELVEETLEMFRPYYDECRQSFHFEKFALYDNYLAIIEECYLPHVIAAGTPEVLLHYKYDSIKKYLKTRL